MLRRFTLPTIILMLVIMYAEVNSSNDNPLILGDVALSHIATVSGATVLTHANDERLFVASQNGIITVLDEDRKAADVPYLDLSDKVYHQGEMGLLGLAFHPAYEENGQLFVNYITLHPTRTVVARYTISHDPNIVDRDSETVILTYDQPEANHNGGDIHFGKDGYLYIASGDGGGAGDPERNGQSKTTLLGKLLRIDVDKTATIMPQCTSTISTEYRIPADNMYADESRSCGEIYAMGLRNPWRFSFDDDTGDIWIGDVGQYRYEEINIIPAGKQNEPHHFGWNCLEGTKPYEEADTTCPAPTTFTPPIYQYGREDGCSITGGFVYRGEALPNLIGRYLYTDFCVPTLMAYSNGTASEISTTRNLIAPVSFGQDQQGELYLLDRADGAIYQLRPINDVWLPFINHH